MEDVPRVVPITQMSVRDSLLAPMAAAARVGGRRTVMSALPTTAQRPPARPLLATMAARPCGERGTAIAVPRNVPIIPTSVRDSLLARTAAAARAGERRTATPAPQNVPIMRMFAQASLLVPMVAVVPAQERSIVAPRIVPTLPMSARAPRFQMVVRALARDRGIVPLLSAVLQMVKHSTHRSIPDSVAMEV